MARVQRGQAQRIPAMSSFAFYRPMKDTHTNNSSRPDATPTSSNSNNNNNNPFVAGGVCIVKPEKDSVAEQGGEGKTQLLLNNAVARLWKPV